MARASAKPEHPGSRPVEGPMRARSAVELSGRGSESVRIPRHPLLQMRAFLVWAGVALAFVLGAGCLQSDPPVTSYEPVVLLERGGAKITLFPDSASPIAEGVFRYSGSARAEIEGDPQAGRSPVTIEGTAEATVDRNANTREFTFASRTASDLGWTGVDAQQVSIWGSGPFDAGEAQLSAGANLDTERSSAWGFSTSFITIAANLTTEQPIYTAYADTGSVGSPLGVVGAPSPGGNPLTANAMALVFAPVGGESAVGPTEAGTWVKFVLGGSTSLRDGATLSWNPSGATLRGGGTVGILDSPAGSVAAEVELTASADASYLSLSGAVEPPQLGVLTSAEGSLWTDSGCSDCGDITLSGGPVDVGPLSIPSLTATQQVRNGVPTSSVIRASRVTGSVGPVTINSGNLTVDMSDMANLVADLEVDGSVLGIPVRTTFRGPFSFDLSQMAVSLTGDFYLNLNNQVVLGEQPGSRLEATISLSGVAVRYVGSLSVPPYGANLSVDGSVNYDLATSRLDLGVQANGSLGSISVTGVGLGLTLTTGDAGIAVSGSLNVGSVSSGTASLENLKVGFSGNTTSSIQATINSASDRVRFRAGTFADIQAYGSLTYAVRSNSLVFNLNFSGRVGSWTLSGGNLALTWPGSTSVSGTLTVGQVTNGQVTISNAVVDFTASSSSVTATLRPTTLTAGSLVSATVSGPASYNTSNSTLTLQLSASGRVGPVNVAGVQAAVTWPQSGNVLGTVTVGNISYGPASLQNTTIGFSASSTVLNASIASTLNVGDPFRLNVALSGSATYNASTGVLGVSITTGSGTMWGKPINGSVTFNVNVSSSTISGSASTSWLRFTYDKFGITLSSTSVNFSVSGGAVSVSGSGNVAVNGPMGNGWLSGSGSFSLNGSQLRSTSYRITLNNVNKTIIWVDVGPRNGAPLTVDIIAGSLSYDAEGKMQARVDTGFPFYCEDLEFKIHAWGDQNVLRVDFEGSWVIGLFGAAGHVDVYDWLSSTNPPMYGYADVRITFFWFRYQTWNGQSIENGGC